MSIDYIQFFIYIMLFFGGVYTGILTIKFLSDEILHKLEISFEDQLEVSINFYNKSLKAQVASINNKLNAQDKINDNFKIINDYLSRTTVKINQLNKDCDTKKELESEIVKLKNIIKRLERKR